MSVAPVYLLWILTNFGLVFGSNSVLNSDLLELNDFVDCQGGNRVTIFYQEDHFQRAFSLWNILLEKLHIYSSLKSLKEENYDKRSRFNIIMASKMDLEIGINRSLDLMRNFTVKSFILYFPDQLSTDQWSMIESKIKNASQNSLFYTAELSERKEIDWKYILTIQGQSQVVINKLRFQSKFETFGKNSKSIIIIIYILTEKLKHCVQEDYDLQGMNVISISLPWAPYLMFEDCHVSSIYAPEFECSNTGALFEATQSLAKR